jgi:nitrate reductase gamma subunit
MITVLMIAAYLAVSAFLGGLLYRFLSTRESSPAAHSPWAKRVIESALDLFLAIRIFGINKLLWAAVMIFRYSLALVLVAHLRYFWVPDVPAWLIALQEPGRTASLVLALSLFFILVIRLSSAALILKTSMEEYLLTIVLLGAACSGLAMNYYYRVDICGAKNFLMNLLALHMVRDEPSIVFPSHLFAFHLLAALVIIALLPFRGTRVWQQTCIAAGRAASSKAGSFRALPFMAGIIIFCALICVTFFAGGSRARPVPMPLRNGTGAYALTVEKNRDKASIYHIPPGWWRISHMGAFKRKDFARRICMRCHSVENHCNRCHRYIGVKLVKESEK